jgi:hypothetical protein
MCYVLSRDGHELLRRSGRLTDSPSDGQRHEPASRDAERELRGARTDVHVVGWVLALAATLGPHETVLRGAPESIVSPVSRTTGQARAPLGLSHLRLPDGRVPHDFLGADGSEVASFDTLRPDALVRQRALAIDLFVERDDSLSTRRGAAKLLRYDHFLAGWSAHTRRYGERSEATPVVVFVCRSRERARSCARTADMTLRACRAYAGEYPIDWDYHGREHTLFVAERDVHEGALTAYGVPRLPPSVRVADAHGDPRAGEASAEPREIPH